MPILLTEKSPQQTAWTRIIIQEAPRLSRRRHSAVASVIRLSIAVLSSGLFGDENMLGSSNFFNAHQKKL
jgi:hypothetical protein